MAAPGTLTLEERVARLEAMQAAAIPAYSPNGGQRVAPDGAVTYDFEGTVHATGGDFTGTINADGNFTGDTHGHVHALGLDIDAAEAAGGTAPPQADSRVRWERASNGAVVADVYGQHVDLNPVLASITNAAHLRAFSSDGARIAGVHAVADDQVPAGTRGSRVTATAGSGASNDPTVTVIDSAGASSFLQLAQAGRYQAWFGSVVATFVTGAYYTNTVRVAHPLPTFHYVFATASKSAASAVNGCTYVQGGNGFADFTGWCNLTSYAAAAGEGLSIFVLLVRDLSLG